MQTNINHCDEENPSKLKCIRSGCSNEAIDDPCWDHEFCSNGCAVSYCKTIFENWVKQNLSTLTNINHYLKVTR